MVTFTVDKNGVPGMPTFNVKKVRKLLKSGRAVIFKYHPFTIQLLYADSLAAQPVELCIDAGDKHIGISVKSEKHEFIHAQYDPLPDEKQRRDDRRKYRRSRRNRGRYRRPGQKRKNPKDWLAPSIEHKKGLHISIAEMYRKVCPLTEATVETASFDTQALEAVEKGIPLPKGTDYQKGRRYRLNTLRDAVFYRDGHRCQLCGSTEGPFAVHHVGYWKKDHSNRMGNLATLCIKKCHIPQNHKKGGPLYGWEPEIRPMRGAAFMNSVRWRIVDELKEKTGLPIKATYGSATKTARKRFCIEKTHANDAFVMGSFHPKHRQEEARYKKNRRNDRILQKFYDAEYLDIRAGKVKSGQELSCGRTKRSGSRHTEKDLRRYRGNKAKKGHVSVRKQRTQLKPGSLVLYKDEVREVHGTHTRKDKKTGTVKTNVEFTHPAGDGRKSADLSKVKVIRKQFISAWKRVT